MEERAPRLNRAAAFSHGSGRHGSLKHTFIAFSIREQRKVEDVGKKEGGGGPVKEEVTLITGPFLRPDTVFPQRRTLACPPE